MKTKTRTIKYTLGIIIFSSALIFNVSIAQASYSGETLVSMTNSARGQNGLGALSTNSALASAAYAKASDILSKDYFAHNSPDSKTPWDFINEAGYTYAYAGENLGIGYTDASELFSAWMNSPTHRENILNSNFREIGIAVVSGEFQGVETIVAVQEFGAAEENAQQVAAQTSTAEPTTSNAPQTNTSPNANQAKNFDFVKDKSNFAPKSIFAGEDVEFKVTISGEVKTLEAETAEKKFNLLETGSLTSAGQEKTYILKQKIENVGTTEVKIIGVDKNGNSDSLTLGSLEVRPTVIAKGQTQTDSGLLAGFKEFFQANWLVYTIFLGVIASAVIGYLIYRKTRFNNLLASWRF